LSTTTVNAVAHDLDELGYAVVPLLTSAEVDALLADFRTCHPDGGSGFETDFERDDAGFKVGVSERTAWVWERVRDIVPGYAPFMASYLAKWPTPDSDLPLHADWSYVDESVHPSYAVWVPLVDTGPTIDNGALAVVPRSHHLVRSWRGTATPAWYEAGAEGFVAAAVEVEAPAGSAVVFDNRLLHHSPPNRTASVRPVLAGAFAPDGAQLIHVVGDGDARGRILEVGAEFFRDHNPSGLRQQRPQVPSGAPEIDLVEGGYDPVSLAADHGVDDAAAFARRADGGPCLRWPEPSEPSAMVALRSVLGSSVDLRSLPWAPDVVDADPAAAIHAPLVVAGRPTPLGRALGGSLLSDAPPWAEVRLIRLRPEAELEVGVLPGRTDVTVIGLEVDDPPVLVVGTGWSALGAGDVARVPGGQLQVRNRASRPAALLVATGTPADVAPTWIGRFAPWAARFAHRAPGPWDLAVELTEAMA